MAEINLSDPVIEIAYTTNAGWAWRCWVCDVNQFNLWNKPEAEELGERHRLTQLHKLKLRADRRG